MKMVIPGNQKPKGVIDQHRRVGIQSKVFKKVISENIVVLKKNQTLESYVERFSG